MSWDGTDSTLYFNIYRNSQDYVYREYNKLVFCKNKA